MDVGFTLNWKCWGEELEAGYREFYTFGSSLSLYLSVPFWWSTDGLRLRKIHARTAG